MYLYYMQNNLILKVTNTYGFIPSFNILVSSIYLRKATFIVEFPHKSSNLMNSSILDITIFLLLENLPPDNEMWMIQNNVSIKGCEILE